MAPHSHALFFPSLGFQVVFSTTSAPSPLPSVFLAAEEAEQCTVTHRLQGWPFITGSVVLFGQICHLSPSGGSRGDAWCLRVKGGCKLSHPAQRVAKPNGSCASGVEDYMKEDLILFCPFCWQLLASRLAKYWGWGCSWVVLGCAQRFPPCEQQGGCRFPCAKLVLPSSHIAFWLPLAVML